MNNYILNIELLVPGLYPNCMVYLFYGENTYEARQKIRELIKRYQATSDSEFGLERFDGSDPTLTAEQIVAAITAVPFLAANRLVIVEDLLANKAVAEKVIAALDRVPESTVLVCYEPNADKRTKLFKDLKERAKPADFKPLNPHQLRAWLKKTAAARGARIDNQTAAFLIDYLGEDQWRLDNEIAKLAAYDPQFTADTVKQLSDPTITQTIFNLLDSLARGQTKQALTMYQNLRSAKAQPLYILTMIAWQLRNLLLVKSAPDTNPQTLAKEASMSPFVVKKSVGLARGIETADLKQAFAAVAEADLQIKTTALNEDTVLTQLIHEIGERLAGARQPA